MTNHPPPQPKSSDPTSPQRMPTGPATVNHPASAQAPPAVPPRQPVVYKPPSEPEEAKPVSKLKIYSHSSLVYWWPVWAVGYLMAILTYWQGEQFQVGQDREWFHPSSNLGVFFFLTLFLVIIITNVSVRGLVSGLVLMGVVLVAVLLANFGWWDAVFAWFGNLNIHLNFGAYFWFSTLMLLVWVVSAFVVDRMSYWHIKPGQVSHVFVLEADSKTYDTIGMVLDNNREDIFRQWLLGLGSGDLEIHTTGATSERIDVFNVLFIGSKVEMIQRLISEDPHAAWASPLCPLPRRSVGSEGGCSRAATGITHS